MLTRAVLFAGDKLPSLAARSRELDISHPVLVSENYWRRRFAADATFLGKTIRLNDATFTVAGITPRDFVGTGVATPDFWLPLRLEPLLHADENWLHDRENQHYRLYGRLASGIGIGQAQAEVNVVANHLRTLHDPRSASAKPATALVWPGSPFPLPLQFFRGLRLTILLILIAAGMVLAVACANAGSLQLARARSRENELRTRFSLGASRVRVVRQLLTESALLALFAGSLALLFTWALLKAAAVLAANMVSVEYGALVFDVNPDLKIFAFVFAISLTTGVLFGLAPALESSRSALVSGARNSTASVRSRRLQSLLVGVQVAFSLALLIAGSLLIRSAIHALRAATGYDAKRVVYLSVQFPEATRYTALREITLMHAIRTRLEALPGITALTSARPPDEQGFQTAAIPLGKKDAAQSILHYTYIQPNYFETLGIPLLLGRGLEASDDHVGHSVILSESAARQLWPGENPIGRSLRLGAVDEKSHGASELFADGFAYQVAGIARDTRGVEFDGSDSKQIYLPLAEDKLANHPLLIRTRSGPADIVKAIQPAIASVDPDLVATASTLDEMLRQTAPFLASSFSAAVASTVGALGLLLASMGIYGTVSYMVVLRTREIGIRMAVGAQKSDVFGLILRDSTRPVFLGLFAGMLLAVGASYLLRGVLHGVHTVDGISFAGTSLLFLTIALLAAYPPARRAMRVDPVRALREE